MRHTLVSVVIGAAALSSAASAASLTTLFNSNNSGSPGGGIYFQLVVGASAITVTGFDVNTTAAAGTALDFRAFTAAGTHAGNEGNAGAWTMVTSGSGTSAGLNLASTINLANTFNLAAGTSYGIALTLSSAAGGTPQSHAYSGTGASPAPGLPLYSDANITLNLGTATNVLFTAPTFNPRVWNGTIRYNLVPAPGAAGLFAVAGLASIRRRR